jgi:hypothetical protein
LSGVVRRVDHLVQHDAPGAVGRLGLSVTCVPKVPIWKAFDFNGLLKDYLCNPMIS